MPSMAFAAKENPDINKVLADITGAVVGKFKLATLLEQVVETSMRTLHAEVCSIFLSEREKEPQVLTMMAGSGFAAKLIGKSKYQIGEGFTGAVAQYGQKFNIRSRQELEDLTVGGHKVWLGKFDPVQWPSGQSEFRNCIAVPLRIKEQILGVIKVENKRKDNGSHFTAADEQYIETIANVVALAVENVRLHEQTENQLKSISMKAAHRINNQITNYDAIQLDLEDQARSAIADCQKLSEIATRVSQTTSSLKRMVTEFRNYGKPLVVDKKRANINTVISDEVWLARPPSNVSIKKEFDLSLIEVNLDAGRFAEALKELLRNSLKAIGSRGGQILIRTIKGTSGADPGPASVVVEIEDTGPGFPREFPIFAPFQSTDPQSTGLGLATVKELIEAHGGQIEASKGSLGGALIRMRIPA